MRLAKTEAQTAEKIAVLRRAALSKKATAPRKAAPATTAVTPRSATPARNSAATRKVAPARKTVTPQSATPAKKRAGPRRAAPAKKASVPTTAARKRRASHNHPKNQGEFDRAEYERHPEAISQQSTKQPPLELTQATAPSKAVAVMLSAMNWAYDTANNAGLGIDSASNMARKYLAHGASADEAIDSLIRWQVTYAGTAGFVTNVGGFWTLPVAIPADLASVLFLQLRMIAAIAHIRGYETTDPHVRTLAFICLAGSSGAELLSGLGMKLGTALTARVPAAALIRINQAVGFRLITKARTTGFINLTKWVPVLGGLIGGGFDAALTRGIGAMAKKLFVPRDKSLDGSDS